MLHTQRIRSVTKRRTQTHLGTYIHQILINNDVHSEYAEHVMGSAAAIAAANAKYADLKEKLKIDKSVVFD